MYPLLPPPCRVRGAVLTADLFVWQWGRREPVFGCNFGPEGQTCCPNLSGFHSKPPARVAVEARRGPKQAFKKPLQALILSKTKTLLLSSCPPVLLSSSPPLLLSSSFCAGEPGAAVRQRQPADAGHRVRRSALPGPACRRRLRQGLLLLQGGETSDITSPPLFPVAPSFSTVQTFSNCLFYFFKYCCALLAALPSRTR